MDLGRYEIETYFVVINGQTQTRQRIVYIGNNEQDIFIERYYGEIRTGYKGSNTFFKNLLWTNIKSHIVGESIVINDFSNPPKPQIYLNISSIESVQRNNENRLIIVDSQIEPITLEFISVFDCDQSYSMLNFILQNPNVDIDTLSSDITPPIIFFNQYFYGELVKLEGSELEGPFSTEDGNSFLVDFSFLDFEGPKPLTKTDILSGLIYDVVDNRDNIVFLEEDLIIYKDVISSENIVDEISDVGIYLCKFHLLDLGQNQNNATIVFSIV
jgi:hypothetical protein